MTFEARDNAAKVVPATTNGNTAEEENQRTSLKVTLFFLRPKTGEFERYILTDQILHLKRIDIRKRITCSAS